jgi:hypothetical protein
MSSYPPADDRLRHLIAQQVNCDVDTWKLAFWIANGIVKCPEIRAEFRRIETAHTVGQPCGDRNCDVCFAAKFATPTQENPA